jgi:hypothetical protein
MGVNAYFALFGFATERHVPDPQDCLSLERARFVVIFAEDLGVL